MNLMMNNYCNLQCSYCFAQETMHSANARYISKENYVKFLNWLKQQGNAGQVRMIGGEPTLHPEIAEFIDIAADYGFENVLIFTNLTFDKNFAEMLVDKNQKIKISLLPNINNLDLILPNLRSKILYNLDYLTMNLEDFARISLNIYLPDQDLKPYERLCARYNIQSMRFSIVVPNYEISKDFDIVEYFHSFQPVLKQLIDFKKNYGIDIDNDCSTLPLCAFDPDFIQYVLQIDPLFFAKGDNCTHPAMDITPDLEVIPCFGLGASKTRRLEDYATIEDMECDLEEERANIYKNFVARTECFGCPRYQTTGQSCPCLTYRKLEVNKYAN